MRLWLTILTMVALVVPTVSFAATPSTDGEECPATVEKISKGEWRTTACVRVCNDYLTTDAGADCDEHDFNTGGGLPDLLVLERVDGGCTNDPTITITTGPTTGGTPSYGISSSAVTLNDATPRVVIVTKDAPMDRYLFFAVSDDVGCATGELDVYMHLLDSRN
jgi:hypothetical protein